MTKVKWFLMAGIWCSALGGDGKSFFRFKMFYQPVIVAHITVHQFPMTVFFHHLHVGVCGEGGALWSLCRSPLLLLLWFWVVSYNVHMWILTVNLQTSYVCLWYHTRHGQLVNVRITENYWRLLKITRDGRSKYGIALIKRIAHLIQLLQMKVLLLYLTTFRFTYNTNWHKTISS